jgi:hypothetical protein
MPGQSKSPRGTGPWRRRRSVSGAPPIRLQTPGRIGTTSKLGRRPWRRLRALAGNAAVLFGMIRLSVRRQGGTSAVSGIHAGIGADVGHLMSPNPSPPRPNQSESVKTDSGLMRIFRSGPPVRRHRPSGCLEPAAPLDSPAASVSPKVRLPGGQPRTGYSAPMIRMATIGRCCSAVTQSSGSSGK